MTLKELKTQLLALTPTEQAEALEMLNKMINSDSSRVTKTAGVCDGEACIENTRIPVWLLVSLRHQGSTDAELLSFYPQLNAGDLVNAWAYAKAHPEEIETAIKEEEEVMKLEI
ncbi:DUF433 domain-containing protein [Microcystis aeruginosa]|uniref:DUF433 domain-containing protein n=1 Tax=Microcystis aeruginosa 11-30S32 TaxID=2358142 RepID=A0A510PDQ8_MICAE|nr:DUF433 domain-containing protein [Microcystis aeruginosa]GCA91904.1 DUF433 domain-containing protein [Microcystis aeruginosa 11-30S32]